MTAESPITDNRESGPDRLRLTGREAMPSNGLLGTFQSRLMMSEEAMVMAKYGKPIAHIHHSDRLVSDVPRPNSHFGPSHLRNGSPDILAAKKHAPLRELDEGWRSSATACHHLNALLHSRRWMGSAAMIWN